jgi:hypothetical protein
MRSRSAALRLSNKSLITSRLFALSTPRHLPLLRGGGRSAMCAVRRWHQAKWTSTDAMDSPGWVCGWLSCESEKPSLKHAPACSVGPVASITTAPPLRHDSQVEHVESFTGALELRTPAFLRTNPASFHFHVWSGKGEARRRCAVDVRDARRRLRLPNAHLADCTCAWQRRLPAWTRHPLHASAASLADDRNTALSSLVTHGIAGCL